ncbi:MAG: CIA30 family protein [Sulfitobacter sp.]
MILTPNWEYVADTVMGGVSAGQIEKTTSQGRAATRLTGSVSLENNGGFVQMAFDLKSDSGTLDASRFTGVEIEVRGNGEVYDVRLRTDELTRPWHSFRTEFTATREWQRLRIPFTDFTPHRTEVTFDPARLRRIGVLAIGRAFQADVSVARVGFY